MRIVFMGTPAFAIPVLSALLDAGYDVVGVYTQPDKASGRGRRVVATPVKQLAQDRELPVFQPASLKSQHAQLEIASLSPDVIVVAAYSQFLPPDTLDLPPLGCLNVHPSLLPRYRGPSPVASAVLDGVAVTGVTIIKLDEGMDSGPIIASRETPVGPQENVASLTTRLFQIGASLLVEILPAWAEDRIQAQPQDGPQATITKRLSKKDGEIDWPLSATGIARQVLAYHPWPGSYTRWRGKQLNIVEAYAVESSVATPSPPGLVVWIQDGGLGIVTGGGVLKIERLRLEGRRTVGAREFIQGHPQFPGSVVGR